MKRLCFLTVALVTFAFVGAMAAQWPLHDKVVVNLPYPVHVEGTVLPPGQYTISEQNKPTDTPGLMVEGKSASVVTPAATMNAIEKPAAPETKVVLRQIGNDYYFDKIWMKGRTFGWQVPLPDNLKDTQGKSVEVSGTYQQGKQ